MSPIPQPQTTAAGTIQKLYGSQAANLEDRLAREWGTARAQHRLFEVPLFADLKALYELHYPDAPALDTKQGKAKMIDKFAFLYPSHHIRAFSEQDKSFTEEVLKRLWEEPYMQPKPCQHHLHKDETGVWVTPQDLANECATVPLTIYQVLIKEMLGAGKSAGDVWGNSGYSKAAAAHSVLGDFIACTTPTIFELTITKPTQESLAAHYPQHYPAIQADLEPLAQQWSPDAKVALDKIASVSRVSLQSYLTTEDARILFNLHGLGMSVLESEPFPKLHAFLEAHYKACQQINNIDDDIDKANDILETSNVFRPAIAALIPDSAILRAPEPITELTEEVRAANHEFFVIARKLSKMKTVEKMAAYLDDGLAHDLAEIRKSEHRRQTRATRFEPISAASHTRDTRFTELVNRQREEAALAEFAAPMGVVEGLEALAERLKHPNVSKGERYSHSRNIVGVRDPGYTLLGSATKDESERLEATMKALAGKEFDAHIMLGVPSTDKGPAPTHPLLITTAARSAICGAVARLGEDRKAVMDEYSTGNAADAKAMRDLVVEEIGKLGLSEAALEALTPSNGRGK